MYRKQIARRIGDRLAIYFEQGTAGMNDEKGAAFDKCGKCGNIVVTGDVVMIPRSDFEAFSKSPRPSVPDYRMRSATKIARNKEQAEFVIECLASMTVTQAHHACVERFGEAAPSRSQVYRFAGDLGLRRAARTERRRF